MATADQDVERRQISQCNKRRGKPMHKDDKSCSRIPSIRMASQGRAGLVISDFGGFESGD